MGPEPSYGKRLHAAARKDFKAFWSAHRWWSSIITVVSAGAAVLLQIAILGTGTVANLALTLSVAVGGLLISLIGNYLISMRRGAEQIDTGLQQQIKENDLALAESGQNIKTLQERLAKPPLSPIEQGRRELVDQKLRSFPANQLELAKAVLRYVLDHGTVPTSGLIFDDLLGGVSNPDLISIVLEKAVHDQLLGGNPGPWTSMRVTINPELKSALSFHLLGE
jgi:hypothetical protein